MHIASKYLFTRREFSYNFLCIMKLVVQWDYYFLYYFFLKNVI